MVHLSLDIFKWFLILGFFFSLFISHFLLLAKHFIYMNLVLSKANMLLPLFSLKFMRRVSSTKKSIFMHQML
jgi:hypothetical protein